MDVSRVVFGSVEGDEKDFGGWLAIVCDQSVEKRCMKKKEQL